ncbi:transmembrane protein, putative [Medicago truncatula]|uniref:Transmembrane protein, putative n=1 Tax=Medicago truncatula TaxID=3880 RepID=A0A072V3S1_MEDTR|nr:transmembrane protein, putative [Medicago truncatula]
MSSFQGRTRGTPGSIPRGNNAWSVCMPLHISRISRSSLRWWLIHNSDSLWKEFFEGKYGNHISKVVDGRSVVWPYVRILVVAVDVYVGLGVDVGAWGLLLVLS